MSAPKTNIEHQKRNHRGPLIGIALALVVVGIIFVVFLGDVSTPEDSLLGEGAIDAAPATITPEPAAPAGN